MTRQKRTPPPKRRLPLSTRVIRWLYANRQDERLAGTAFVAGPAMALAGVMAARRDDLLAGSGLIVGGLIVFIVSVALMKAHNRLDDLQPRRRRRRGR